MTAEQRKLAYDLAINLDGNRAISPDDFAQRFPSAIHGGKLAVTILEEAIDAESCADLEAALVIGATFGFTAAHILPLCEILRADWHTAHENIVATLQAFGDPRTVDTLYETALFSYSYLDYDEFFGLARKCTWALADIGTQEALIKLRLLAASDNHLIAEYAQKRIDHWDSEKHRKHSFPG